MELSVLSLLKSISFLGWSVLYLWVATVWAPTKSPEWHSRVVTVLHGTVAAVCGVYQCQIFNMTVCDVTAPNKPYHYALMLWSWGYFAFDLLWCLIYWWDNKVMLLHHVITLAGISLFLGKVNTGCRYPCTLAFMEVTNPLLQARWFLRAYGYQQSIIFLLVEIIYLVLFVAIRGGLGTYLIYLILKTSVISYQEKIYGLFLYIVSMVFLYEIFGFVVHKYKNKLVSMRLSFLDRLKYKVPTLYAIEEF